MDYNVFVRRETKDFLRYVDALELQKRISQFRKRDFKKLSYNDISEAIRNVIVFDTPKGPMSILRPNTARYPAGTKFYRVRTIPADDREIPLRSISKIGDCWEPPAESVGIGRLNKKNEPLLYTSPIDLSIAIEELGIPDDEFFSLIVYEAKENVNVTLIGEPPNTEDFNDNETLKLKMIQDFLRDEFTRDVGVGTEYLYKISECIAKDYFDLPPDFHDAWCYPSIAKKDSFNVAFRPQTRTKLRLVGVQIAKARKLQDGSFLITAYMIAKEMNYSEDLSYFKIGSAEQRELFPEIKQGSSSFVDIK